MAKKIKRCLTPIQKFEEEEERKANMFMAKRVAPVLAKGKHITLNNISELEKLVFEKNSKKIAQVEISSIEKTFVRLRYWGMGVSGFINSELLEMLAKEARNRGKVTEIHPNAVVLEREELFPVGTYDAGAYGNNFEMSHQLRTAKYAPGNNKRLAKKIAREHEFERHIEDYGDE